MLCAWMLRTLFGPKDEKRLTSRSHGSPCSSTRTSIMEKSLNFRQRWTRSASFWILSNNSGSSVLDKKLVTVVGALPVQGNYSQIQFKKELMTNNCLSYQLASLCCPQPVCLQKSSSHPFEPCTPEVSWVSTHVFPTVRQPALPLSTSVLYLG